MTASPLTQTPILPVTPASPEPDAPHTPAPPASESFFDAILRDGEAMTRRLIDPEQSMELMRKMLALSVFAFGSYGAILGALMHMFSPLNAEFTMLPALLWVPLSLALGFVVAIAVGLPSFYFYTQLAGLDAPFRLITAQSVRVHARSGVFLMGVTPFYLAFALVDYTVHQELSLLSVAVGFAVPFLCGLFGLASLYKNFKTLVNVLPVTHERRGNGIMRLVACWAVFGAVLTPVSVWRIATLLSMGH